ncbi:probable glycosyltransferase 7 [Asparagus officinalis]|uniref:probable glycosyltransferase 7 n=1 Tax=Asparagus officinalis TaxID=4686 RepID=UPI00098E7A8F|nr:probable glycosyltransferase 7 [Asparagus officinalis]
MAGAHAGSEWLWLGAIRACITDIGVASVPLEKKSLIRAVNPRSHTWPRLVYEARSWTSLNAGVFLMRNCQWSLDFIDRWSRMGPQSPEYERWGSVQRSVFKDKLYAESDDQTGIAYLLLKEKERWGDKIYLESSFYFEGYWVEIVNKLEKIEEKYLEIERKVKGLRRRRAEKVSVAYGRLREEFLEGEGLKSGVNGWRRPFITHFTGCQPCSGDHNKLYSGENCFEGMQKALNFADNQVLRAYGFTATRGSSTSTPESAPLPFDFPGGRLEEGRVLEVIWRLGSNNDQV